MKSSLAICDDFLLDIAYEGFNPEPGLNDNKVQLALKKIGKVISEFAEGLVKMVIRLINRFKNMFSNANKQLNAVKSIASVVDTYDYVSLTQNVSEVINTYHSYLVKVRELDHEINKTVSIADSIKDTVKDNALRRKNTKATKRDMLEEVIFYFGKMDVCKESLDKLWETAKKEIPSPHPKRYSLDFIRKEMSISFTSKIRTLQNLKSQLEITKKMYADRNWMYRNAHKEDIRRNQNLLNYTASLIRSVEEFRTLYIKLLSQIEGVDVSEGDDTDD